MQYILYIHTSVCLCTLNSLPIILNFLQWNNYKNFIFIFCYLSENFLFITLCSSAYLSIYLLLTIQQLLINHHVSPS